MTHLNSISKIIQQADGFRLPCLIVGSRAVNLYGITRFTRDFNLLIPDTKEKAWIQFLLNSFNYHMYHSNHAFLQFDNTSKDFPSLDIMLVDSDTLGKLIAKSGNEKFGP